jgi:inosose dehydratase
MVFVGNAPCSWGTLEFEGEQAGRLTHARMLDELVEAGYTGTELGDWGFMPSEPAALKRELATRGLTMTGAFVPVNFRDAAAHAGGEARAVRTASLLAAVADPATPPFLVLADDNCKDLQRTQHASRATPGMMLSDADWATFAAGVNQVAHAVRRDTGLRSVFHHHGGGFVETPVEIHRLLTLTDPDLVGLVFDTGHYVFGAGSSGASGLIAAMDRWAARIWYVHLKDCSAALLAQSARENWDYHSAIRHGVFCELGQGDVPFPAVKDWLDRTGYTGFVTVEQDVLPGMGAPKQSARRNRDYLKSIGL